ncbi:unnamed protein product [Rhizophagus irregularis]|nr:unnamed protein product [Rhizophagus irregularis]
MPDEITTQTLVYFPVAFWTEEFRRFQGTVSTFRRFDGSLDIPEFNISKVWWFLSLNVWNLTFQRFSPASTSASDI